VLEALGVVHHSCIDCVALVIDAGILEGGEGEGRRWMQKEGMSCLYVRDVKAHQDCHGTGCQGLHAE